MGNKLIVTAVVGFLLMIGVFVGGLVIYKFSVDNEIAMYQIAYEKQMGRIEGFHDLMWKTISQKAQIAEKHKKAFQEIYVGIMEGRYSGDSGKLMLWITEQNPNFDQGNFADLSKSVEALRREFFKVQDDIRAIVAEHNKVLAVMPSKLFVSSAIRPLKYEEISSARSKEVIETREDNNVDVFGN